MARPANPKVVQLWKDRFAQLTKSQLTIHQFCQSIGCSVASYYHWKRKLQGSAAESKTVPHSKPGFIPVTIRQDVARIVNVELPGGTKVHLPVDAIEALRLIIEHDQRVA